MSIDDREKPSGPLVRRLIRTSRSGVLATVDAETGGTPYASFVLTSCTMDASPLLLLSDLARHSRNISADTRVSVIIGKLGLDALSQTRATLIGTIEPSDDADQKARFLRHHAGARSQMTFGDFRLYRLRLESVHFIAGFGRIETLDAGEVVLSQHDNPALAQAETEILDHMNNRHTQAVHAYANVLADRHGRGWTMSGIDPEGFDLMRNDAESRVDFETTVDGPESARAELVRLAALART
jgi:putative heme iron utilization protein